MLKKNLFSRQQSRILTSAYDNWKLATSWMGTLRGGRRFWKVNEEIDESRREASLA